MFLKFLNIYIKKLKFSLKLQLSILLKLLLIIEYNVIIYCNNSLKNGFV
jgi:hypothetical protein